MMQSVLGNASKVLIDQKSGNSLLYLPLDQLLKTQAGSGSPTSADTRPPAAPEATVTLEPARGRELPRSRDRGDVR
jgi:membrane protease subunit HflK